MRALLVLGRDANDQNLLQTTSVAILDSAGNLVMEAILETKAETILRFMR
jgi:hypothetical protein